MPKLWTDTIEAHRRAVRDAVLDASATLVAERGLRGVTMAEIAEAAGIGRATLYKYFPDVDAILHAWHDRQLARHVAHLSAARDGGRNAGGRLRAVLHAYGMMRHDPSHGHDLDIAVMFHGPGHVARIHGQLHDLVRELIRDAAGAGEVRSDVSADELASYAVNALAGAGELATDEGVERLVDLTMAGLRPDAGREPAR